MPQECSCEKLEAKQFHIRIGWVTKHDLALFYRVCDRTIDNWVARKRIPFRKIGRSVRFSLGDVEAALQRYDLKAIS